MAATPQSIETHYRQAFKSGIESAFQQLQFGRASAVGVVLTVLIMLVTAAQFRLSRRFVFYS